MWSVFDLLPLLKKKKEKEILETVDRICEWDSYISYCHFRTSDYKPESVKMPETRERERERNRRGCRQRATIAYRPFFFFFFLIFFFRVGLSAGPKFLSFQCARRLRAFVCALLSWVTFNSSRQNKKVVQLLPSRVIPRRSSLHSCACLVVLLEFLS